MVQSWYLNRRNLEPRMIACFKISCFNNISINIGPLHFDLKPTPQVEKKINRCCSCSWLQENYCVYILFLSLPLWDLFIVMPELRSFNWNIGKLGLRFSMFLIQCLKGWSFSVRSVFSYFWLCLSPFFSLTLVLLKSVCPLNNVRNIWHTTFLSFFILIKRKNSPEGFSSWN